MGISPIFRGVFGGGLLGFLYVVDYHEYDFWGAFFLNFSRSGDGYLIRLFQQQHIGVKIENLLTILGLAQFGMF